MHRPSTLTATRTAFDHRARAGILALAALLALAARPLHAATLTVTIDKFAYSPKELTVAPGDTVVWINRDQTPHTVTARDKSFGSAGLDTDDKYTFKFTKPGDFAYFCSMHPFMTASIHVHQ
ncbi:MAG: cupredoxin family copper-binding protein [Proteobacteria bacterium]|nr:cupredoxin family copper-binding protein [Pseudomonadota bacterium]